MPNRITSRSKSGQLLMQLLQNTVEFIGDLKQIHQDAYREISFNSLIRRHSYLSIHRLSQKGLIATKFKKHEKYIELTKKGKEVAHKLLTEKINLPHGKWDGKWRLLCFDIPESNRRERAFLRNFLFRNGFRKYQQSVWITPYNILPIILRAVAFAELRQFTRTVTADCIDDEREFKILFKLS